MPVTKTFFFFLLLQSKFVDPDPDNAEFPRLEKKHIGKRHNTYLLPILRIKKVY